ncbi:MAG: DUF2970 domain-containing protein [Opitutaceae bacterium]|nr:DUF2970 domain-containing protein [Opitutaceae bacterium]
MQSLTFWEILVSTLSGAIGVQSNRNRQGDFSRGTFTQFIFAGILFTFLFVLSVTIVVRLVLS